MAANILFSLLLMGPMQHNGLALAASLSSALNLGILLVLLRRKTGRMDGRRIMASLIKTSIATCCMILILGLVGLASLPCGGFLRLAAELVIGFFRVSGFGFCPGIGRIPDAFLSGSQKNNPGCKRKGLNCSDAQTRNFFINSPLKKNGCYRPVKNDEMQGAQILRNEQLSSKSS